VGLVTRAAEPLLEGGVPVLLVSSEVGRLVALSAQLALLGREGEGPRRIVGHVAALASHLGHGGMGAGLEQTRQIRGMGIVTALAARLGDRKALVRRLKSSAARLVAGEAKGSLLPHEETLLVRAVGSMAGPAAFGGEDRVNDRSLVLRGVMALVAGLGPRGGEKMLSAGAVRVVAGGAAALRDRGVEHRSVKAGGGRVMTAHAECVPLLLQDQLRHQTVPHVTALATLLPYTRVDALETLNLLGQLRVAVETTLLLELPALRVRRRGQGERQSDEEQGEAQERVTSPETRSDVIGFSHELLTLSGRCRPPELRETTGSVSGGAQEGSNPYTSEVAHPGTRSTGLDE
jgi:hypothetical protein